MLAGFVLLSTAVGLVVMGASVALSMPLWVTLAAYPTICSLTLLLCAALWGLRSSAPASHDLMQHQHSHG